jgi:hypothetical protein
MSRIDLLSLINVGSVLLVTVLLFALRLSAAPVV